MFDSLRQILTHENPSFSCIAAGDRSPSPVSFTTPIDHETTPPLDEDSLNQLALQIGNLSFVLAFYRTWGSLRLFRGCYPIPQLGRPSAYYIAPPVAWEELRESVDDWWSQLDEDERDDILPDWSSDYAVIGEVPNSGNYFLLVLKGQDRGKVYEFEHDGFEFIERGTNFEDFLNVLARTDPKSLAQIGGHTRYGDGQTSTQWVPREYAHGRDI